LLPRLNFRSKTRRFGRLIVFSTIFLVFFPRGAFASTYQVTGAQDFYFLWGEDQTVTVRTYAWQYGIDSMLWVYDSNNSLIIANDDYFGLDSYVSFTAIANTVYRVRAGVCCWNPERWYGQSYELVTNVESVQPPSTTVPETTTTVPETTTTEQTTTTTESPTTTTEPPTTTTEPPTTTTSTEPPTTTTELVSTTLPYVPETAVSTTVPVVDTTTAPEPEVVLPDPTTTSSVTTSSTSTVPRTTTTSVAVTTTQPEVVAPTTTTTVVSAPEPLDEQVVTEDSTPEPILSQVPSENLEQFFEALDMSALSPEEQTQVINELNNASEEVKKEFEDTVNIYSGEFDEYVPVGSVITVGERKVLIAATGVLFVAPTISSGATSSSTQSTETRRGRK
jgi:hypothetical protein